MVKDVLWLRSLSVIASIISIFYNFNVAQYPIWVPIFWNVFFISLNFYHIFKIIYGNKNIHLNEKEKELFELFFQDLSLMEFSKLIKIGKWKKFEPSQIMINKDQPMDDLFMIYNGVVEARVDNKVVGELKDGQFIGEMSFYTDGKASATVLAKYPTEVICWKQNELKELMRKSPTIIYSLQQSLLQQMAINLKKNNENNHPN